MLNTCYVTWSQIGHTINHLKSHCICFGSYHRLNKPLMQIGDENINWSATITYRGVNVMSSKLLMFDICAARQAFSFACNCVFASAKYNDQIVYLSLHEVY